MTKPLFLMICGVLLPHLFCTSHKTAEDATSNKTGGIRHPDTITATQSNTIVFNDSSSIPVCDRTPSDIPIDSIALSYKKVDGVFSVHSYREADSALIRLLRRTSPENLTYASGISNYQLNTYRNRCNVLCSNKAADSLAKYHIATADITVLTLYSSTYRICSILYVDSITPTVQRHRSKLLSFNDVTTLPVSSKFYSDIVPDSLGISHKSFSGVYSMCGKGNMDIRDYQLLRATNPHIYNTIKNITTAFSITNNNNEHYFSGKTSDWCSIPQGSNVRIGALIISFFLKGEHLSNVLIIDSMNTTKQKLN